MTSGVSRSARPAGSSTVRSGSLVCETAAEVLLNPQAMGGRMRNQERTQSFISGGCMLWKAYFRLHCGLEAIRWNPELVVGVCNTSNGGCGVDDINRRPNGLMLHCVKNRHISGPPSVPPAPNASQLLNHVFYLANVRTPLTISQLDTGSTTTLL